MNQVQNLAEAIEAAEPTNEAIIAALGQAAEDLQTPHMKIEPMMRGNSATHSTRAPYLLPSRRGRNSSAAS